MAMRVPVPARVLFEEVAAGTAFTCAAERSSGNVWCWGKNDAGQLGFPPSDPGFTPVQTSFSGATQLALGQWHTCATLGDHSAWCWGNNGNGQLGNGNTTSTPTAVQALPPGRAFAVTAGLFHSCAIAAESSSVKGASCWGSNIAGALGNGDDVDRVSSTPVVGLTQDGISVSQLSAGKNHTCALKADGAVLCWGYDGYDQLGDPSGTDSTRPLVVPLVCP
jgi:alpha-tubulin suppressor-like RCC1 family protein